MNSPNTPALWDSLYSKAIRHTRNRMNEETVAGLAARLGPDFEGDILDVATGDGRYAYMFAERWPRARILGIDFAANTIDHLKRDLEKQQAKGQFLNVGFETGDAFNLVPFITKARHGMFDVAFNGAMIQYVLDRTQHVPMLQAAMQVVRPGGYVSVGTSNRWNVFNEALKWVQGPNYRFYPELSLTPEYVYLLGATAGLTDIEIYGAAPHWGLERLEWVHPFLGVAGGLLGDAYYALPDKTREKLGSKIGFIVNVIGRVRP
jgi:SAM-dependent methyltransferase